ncbi:unnamed protein product, partial [Mesorhabditis belari]|uniref:HAP1 N-terminal domain-containing protein n=1 Tax=Mesorhabditis belari TaxID=2138241 RepID=A0AAF3EJ45_9BILA
MNSELILLLGDAEITSEQAERQKLFSGSLSPAPLKRKASDVSVRQSDDEILHMTAENVKTSMTYFEKSVTARYMADGEGPEGVAALLKERTRDLELAARIGQSLLDQNKELQNRNEFLEESLATTNDTVVQLRHELQKRVDLLRVYSNFEENDLDANRSYGSEESLRNRVERLTDENEYLKSERSSLQHRIDQSADKERKVIRDLNRQLENANDKLNKLQLQILGKTDECTDLEKKVKRLLNEITYRTQNEKELIDENVDLKKSLEEACLSQDLLASQLGDLQESYAEVRLQFSETEEELRALRALQNRSISRDSLLYDSLASELENSDSGFSRLLEGTEPCGFNHRYSLAPLQLGADHTRYVESTSDLGTMETARRSRSEEILSNRWGTPFISARSDAESLRRELERLQRPTLTGDDEVIDVPNRVIAEVAMHRVTINDLPPATPPQTPMSQKAPSEHSTPTHGLLQNGGLDSSKGKEVNGPINEADGSPGAPIAQSTPFVESDSKSRHGSEQLQNLRRTIVTTSCIETQTEPTEHFEVVQITAKLENVADASACTSCGHAVAAQGQSKALTIPEACPLPPPLPMAHTTGIIAECSTSLEQSAEPSSLNGTAAQRPRSLRFLQLKTDTSSVILPISAPGTSKDTVESIGGVSKSSSTDSLADYVGPKMGEPGMPGSRDLDHAIRQLRIRRQMEAEFARFRERHGLQQQALFNKKDNNEKRQPLAESKVQMVPAIKELPTWNNYAVVLGQEHQRAVLPWRAVNSVGLSAIQDRRGHGVLSRIELPSTPNSSPVHAAVSMPRGGLASILPSFSSLSATSATSSTTFASFDVANLGSGILSRRF